MILLSILKFRVMNIDKVKKVKTVWDNFTKENPGTSVSISIDNKDIYNIFEELKSKGLYFAQRRER